MRIGFIIRGLYQYSNLIKPLISNKRFNNEDIYIYYNSYTNNKVDYNDAQVTHELNKYNLIDISKRLNIYKLLRNNNLDYMIFFNPGQVYDLFITILCNQLDIKTIYCQHGLSLDFGSFDIKTISKGKNFKNKIRSLMNYLYYYKSILLNFIFIKNKYRNLRYIIKRSIQVIFYFGKNDFSKFGLKEFHCDYGLVFGKYDKEYLINKNGFLNNQIIVGGYPMLPEEKKFEFPISNYILYLSGGLRVSNVISITLQEEIDFYRKLSKIVNDNGKTIVIKLHPREDLKLFEKYIGNLKNVYVYKDINLSNLVKLSNLVIGDYSTALFYPIIYKKPIILLQSEYMKVYPFDYNDFKIGLKASFDELSNVINNKVDVDIKAYNNFIDRYIGISNHTKDNILYDLIMGEK